MKESGYYPAGAEFDPDAPYNQKDLPEITKQVRCIFTIEKVAELVTDDYLPDGNEYEMIPDTSSTDWEDEYDKQCHTPLQLYQMLGDYLRDELRNIQNPKSYKYRKLSSLLDELNGWEITDKQFEEE